MTIPFIDEQEDPQNEVTPTPSEALSEAMRQQILEVRVAVPATVVRYDHKKQLADVQPDFKRKYQDGQVADPPIIYNVPVKHPRAGASFIHLPLKPGHKVWLSFADRSLESWLSNGEAADPQDTRAHHISDAAAYPGGYPFSDAAPVNNGDDVIIKNDELEFRIKPNGRLQVLNGSDELVRILEDWMTADINGSHPFKLRVRERLRTFLVK